jgi:hypothetical protein
MHYVVFCADSENGESLRKEHLEAHLAHIKTVADKLMVAGPCPPEDGERGASMLVVEAENVEEARSLIEADPYFQSGIWDSVMVRAFRAVAGEWVPKT